ncbi:MGMT family protein [Kocuria tytonicola]|uniref:MGMT family protein n=1 Tax=Kocuria tytonicola TaxID=2055946 RepID=UPI001F0C0F65|nr:MGMT family protein [Kocuria tytonicola]
MSPSQNRGGPDRPGTPRAAGGTLDAAGSAAPANSADTAAADGRHALTGHDAAGAVRGVVLGIPRARVLSYGDVAELAGLATPRLAARIMALGQAGEDAPWWRVVRADGTLPDRLQITAREHYEREGTPLRETSAHWVQVDMPRARWNAPAPR